MSTETMINERQSKVPYMNRGFQMGGNVFSADKILTRSFQSVTFIIGEPGMGKSTTLRFLATKYENRKMLYDFCECPHKDLADENSDLYLSPIDFFVRQMNLTSDEQLAQDRRDGKLGIFLDGFDYIYRFYGEKTFTIIRKVLKENCSVIITSCNEFLPENFKAKYATIMDFSHYDQVEYLNHYNLSKEHATKDYFKIPLHLEMYCKLHGEVKENNLGELYEAFIQNEIDQFCQDNSNDNKKFMNMHLNLAVLYSLGKEIIIQEEIMKEDEITMLKEAFSSYNFFGLVKVIEEDRIVFVHGCFAEYLTAKWLHENSSSDILGNVFKKHQRTAEFFNQIVNLKHPNTAVSAIISNDLDKINTLCEKEDDCLLSPDTLGRYPIHIAAWYSQYNRSYDFYYKIYKYTNAKDESLLSKKDQTILNFTCSDYRNIKDINFDKSILNKIEKLVENGVHPDDIFINEKGEFTQNTNYFYNKGALLYSISHRFGGKTSVKLLQKGAHLEVKDSYNPVWISLELTEIEPLEILLKYASDQIDIDQLLHNAVLSRSDYIDEKIKLLLEHGANVNTRDYVGREPLHIAVLKKNRSPLPKIKVLLQYGANPNNFSEDGETSLHIAAMVQSMYDYSDEIRMLLESGADPNLKNHMGRNALHLISNYLYQSLEAFKLILSKIDDINAKDNEGKTCLHYVAGYPYGSTNDKIKLLLEHGANPQHADNSGRTVLHYAASSNSESTVKVGLLLDLVDVNHLDLEGKFALHLAAENPHPTSEETVKLLLDNGASPNIKDHARKSCLHHASSVTKVKMLLEVGANPKECDNTGRNCLHCAALSNSNDSLEIMKLFLEILDPNLQDNEGKTCLHHAASSESKNSLKKLEILLKQNPDPNMTDNSGKHSLFSAVFSREQSSKKIILLLENGALPNLTDVEGKTCLHYIAMGKDRHDAILQVRMLLKNGGDVNITDNHGKTCEDYCKLDSPLGRQIQLLINKHKI